MKFQDCCFDFWVASDGEALLLLWSLKRPWWCGAVVPVRRWEMLAVLFGGSWAPACGFASWQWPEFQSLASVAALLPFEFFLVFRTRTVSAFCPSAPRAGNSFQFPEKQISSSLQARSENCWHVFTFRIYERAFVLRETESSWTEVWLVCLRLCLCRIVHWMYFSVETILLTIQNGNGALTL